MHHVKVQPRRTFDKEEHQKILSKTSGVCAHCGKSLDEHDMTIDHVFPVSKGGLHDEYNLLPLCEECNVEKSDFVYPFDDWYRHVNEEELEKFNMYYNYANYEYCKKSIIGYDSLCFHFIPRKFHKMLRNAKNRGMNKKKLQELMNNCYVSIPLTKAYPGEAERIYDFLEKMQPEWNAAMSLYHNKYNVLEDIETGCVYTLELNGNICGVFGFRHISHIKEGVDVPQLMNAAETLNFKVKYVMVCAVINYFAKDVYDNVMMYLENAQIYNGWMPVFFGILNATHTEKHKCIMMPYTINDISSTLEFMPVSYLKTSRRDNAEHIFIKHGYKDYSSDDIDYFVDVSLMYSYEKDYQDDETMLAFLERFPILKSYFKSTNYELYDVGFEKST